MTNHDGKSSAVRTPWPFGIVFMAAALMVGGCGDAQEGESGEDIGTASAAATYTGLHPTSGFNASNTTATGSCTSQWDCINEALPGDGGTSYISKNSGVTSGYHTATFSSSDTTTVTSVTFHMVVATGSGSGTATVSLYDHAVSDTNPYSTGSPRTLTSTFTEFQGTFSGVNISKISNLYVRVTLNNTNGSTGTLKYTTLQLDVTTTGSGGTSNDPVLAGAGDIASNDHEAESAAELTRINPDYVFTMGDNTYGSLSTNQGDMAHYLSWYDPTWGIDSLKAKSLPVPGNHDYGNYDTSSSGQLRVMQGYHAYFNGENTSSPTHSLMVGGSAWNTQHYAYTITLPSGKRWRFIALNSGPCLYDSTFCSDESAGSEYDWFKNQELAVNNKTTKGYAGIMVVTHFMQFDSTGCGGGRPSMDHFVAAMYDYKVDIVLMGHVHKYERFNQVGRSPGTYSQSGCTGSQRGPVRDTAGPFMVNVGTGGTAQDTFLHGAFSNTVKRYPSSTNGTDFKYGVAKVTLHDTSFSYAFYDGSGNLLDGTVSYNTH